MPVAQGDLSLRRSAVISSDPLTNGGKLSSVLVGTTLFPSIPGSERTTGVTRWRKVFLKNEAGTGAIPNKESSPSLSLIDAKIYLANCSAGEDYFLIKAASDNLSVEDDETDTGWAGAGTLDADVAQGATTLDVNCELNGSAGEIFQDDETVLIASGSTKEFVTLDAVGGVAWNGSVATLTFTNTPLQNNFTALLTDTADIYTNNSIGNSGLAMTPNEHVSTRIAIVGGTGAGQLRRTTSNSETTFFVEFPWTVTPSSDSVFEVYLTTVSQCVSLGTIGCSYTAPVLTLTPGSTGTFTPGITLYPIGCVDDNWTILFSNATTFTLTGDETGSLGQFTVAPSDTKPTNGASFYFKIDSAAFGGTFVNGDTITFTTVSASASAWVKQVVPQGAAPHRANSVDIGGSGDTV